MGLITLGIWLIYHDEFTKIITQWMVKLLNQTDANPVNPNIATKQKLIVAIRLKYSVESLRSFTKRFILKFSSQCFRTPSIFTIDSLKVENYVYFWVENDPLETSKVNWDKMHKFRIPFESDISFWDAFWDLKTYDIQNFCRFSTFPWLRLNFYSLSKFGLFYPNS